MNARRFMGEVEEGLIWFAAQLQALVGWFKELVLK